MNKYQEKIYTVSEFIARLNDFLAMEFDMAAVEGEVSEFKVSQNKWVWFKLKDESSVMDCFMTMWQLKIPLEDGMRIRAIGFPQIFARSGKFSFKPYEIELVGEGALKKAFEMTKKKLEAEGLFAPERRRALPKFPEVVGLITSKDAAAYSDFLRILNNRWKGILVQFYPVSVQGKSAVEEIVSAFEYFNEMFAGADLPVGTEQCSVPTGKSAKTAEIIPQVLVLTRGGGSLEDLQPFNDEAVARAIFSSKIPVLCGVGHERDITIADLVADQRASTPSNAAEILVPERKEMERQISFFETKLLDGMDELLENFSQEVESFLYSLNKNILLKKEKFFARKQVVIEKFIGFQKNIELQAEKLFSDAKFFSHLFSQKLESEKGRLKQYINSLSSLSIPATLKRGYSISLEKETRTLIRSTGQLRLNQKMTTYFQDGEADSEVFQLR